MRYTHLAFLSAIAVFLTVSCRPDFQKDFDSLKDRYAGIEERIGALERQVSEMNGTLANLSLLSAAVEQNFYITDVKETDGGYELTMSNGSKIRFFKGPGNTLVPVPPISMTQISGVYYWTIGGTLLRDPSGNPIRSTDFAPIIKYDSENDVLLISVDGGVTFKDINVYCSIVINNTVLSQVINNYFSLHSSTFVSQQMLYQVVSSYIQRNYSELFNVELLDEVVSGYIHENYARMFHYELLEQIFTQYDFEYYTSQIDVNHLVEIIVTFIREHNEILMDNEVLYQIISSYLSANQTTIFSSDLLLEIINGYIENNQLVIDEAMLTRVVSNFIDKHRDTVFNTESVLQILQEYVRKYYIQAFSQTILMQLLSVSISENSSTLFNETLIREIISTYVQNNYTEIIGRETVQSILNEFIEKNGSTLFNLDVLLEITRSWFEKNYNTVIDQTVIETEINNYVETHRDSIISTEIIEYAILSYVRWFYKDIFNYDLINVLVTDYFSSNTEIIKQYVEGYTDIVSDFSLTDDCFTIILSNGKSVKLAIFSAYDSLRRRVQSIILLPNDEGGRIKTGSTSLTYLVSPAGMAPVIAGKFGKEVYAELIYTDNAEKLGYLKISQANGSNDGKVEISAKALDYSKAKTVALHLQETKGGMDIMTEFTPVASAAPQTTEPEAIDLGLSVKWASFNVGATRPEEAGDYFAWGETEPKSDYSSNTYKWRTNNHMTKYYETDCKTVLDPEDDAATVNLGGDWRMPTEAEFEELMDSGNCTWQWTTLNGVQGCKVTSKKNGNSIFLPAAKFKFGTSIAYGNQYGCYPTASLDFTYRVGYSLSASVYFNQDGPVWAGSLGGDWNFRENGQTVRAVYGSFTSVSGISLNIKSIELVPGEDVTIKYTITPASATYKRVTWVSEDPSVATVEDGFVLAIAPGKTNIKVISAEGRSASCSVTVTNDFAIPEAVDLGLPGGVKWASFNLGAANPEGNGLHYAWGETTYKTTRTEFKWANYLWGDGSKNKLTKYNTDSSYGTVDNRTQLLTTDDAARKALGGSWRLPTKAEAEALMNPSYCTWEIVTVNGKECYQVTSKSNGRKIYIPKHGSSWDGSTYYGSTPGLYTSTLRTEDCRRAYAIWLNQKDFNIGYPYRYVGLYIRPVTN